MMLEAFSDNGCICSSNKYFLMKLEFSSNVKLKKQLIDLFGIKVSMNNLLISISRFSELY